MDQRSILVLMPSRCTAATRPARKLCMARHGRLPPVRRALPLPTGAHTAHIAAAGLCPRRTQGMRTTATVRAHARRGAQVAHRLQDEFPALRQLATLSPLPGFRAWLEAQLHRPAPAVRPRRPLGLHLAPSSTVSACARSSLAGAGPCPPRPGSGRSVSRAHASHASRVQPTGCGRVSSGLQPLAWM